MMEIKDFFKQAVRGLDSVLFPASATGVRTAIIPAAAGYAVIDLRKVTLAETMAATERFEDEALAAFQAGTFVMPFAHQWLIHADDFIDDYGISKARCIIQFCYQRNPRTGVWTGPDLSYMLDLDGRVQMANRVIPHGKYPTYDYKDDRALPARSTLSVLYYLSLPHSHTETLTPIPKAVNQLRRARGMAPLQPLRVITLHPLPARVYVPKGSTHASPVGHVRRGHLRRLNNGVLVPVKSSKVNGGGAMPHIKVKP